LEIHEIAKLRISGSIDPRALPDTTTFWTIESPVKKILKHLGLWDLKGRPPPKVNSPPMTPEYHIDYTDSQLPASDNYLYVDPVYSDGHPA
jgi:hypothetical protein